MEFAWPDKGACYVLEESGIFEDEVGFQVELLEDGLLVFWEMDEKVVLTDSDPLGVLGVIDKLRSQDLEGVYFQDEESSIGENVEVVIDYIEVNEENGAICMVLPDNLIFINGHRIKMTDNV